MRESVIRALEEIYGIQVLEYLGSGGFAEAYKGIYCGEIVTIKIPKIDLFNTLSQSMIEKFKREITIWHKLKHKNIVKLINYSFTPLPILVTEYCEYTLRSILQQQGALELPQAMYIFHEILNGLNYACLLYTSPSPRDRG